MLYDGSSRVGERLGPVLFLLGLRFQRIDLLPQRIQPGIQIIGAGGLWGCGGGQEATGADRHEGGMGGPADSSVGAHRRIRWGGEAGRHGHY